MWTEYTCVYVLACCRPHYIRLLNKGLYYALCGKGVVIFFVPWSFPLESFGVSKVHANVTHFISQFWQLEAKIRPALHVLSLCNLFIRVVTSNLSITPLCTLANASHSVAVYCVVIHILPSPGRSYSDTFLTSGKRGTEMWRGSPEVEAVYAHRLLTGPPAWGFTSHWGTHELHTAPELLLSCSVNKSECWCNFRSTSVYVGFSNKHTGEEKQ